MTERPSLVLDCNNVGSGVGRRDAVWIEGEEGFSSEHFIIPHHYAGSIQCVLIPRGLIRDRIERLACDIKKAYDGCELHVLCILKGSRGFFNQLLTFLNKIHTYGSDNSGIPPYMEHYVRLKSYENDTSGELEINSDDLFVLRNKHVLIVEDIIDTGNTLTKFCSWLVATHQPKSLRVASLLEKRTSAANGFKGDFVGFSVPDGFVVGFSLDYNEMFRDLEHICLLNEAGRVKYAVPSSLPKQDDDLPKKGILR